MESSNKYKVNLQGKTIEVERLPNGKFKIPEEVRKIRGGYSGAQFKPAVEIILVVSKGRTISWLDDCRIPYQSEEDKGDVDRFAGIDFLPPAKGWNQHKNATRTEWAAEQGKGRFPANLLVSDDVLNNGINYKNSKGGNSKAIVNKDNMFAAHQGFKMNTKPDGIKCGYGDSGSYSRYFSLDQWADKTLPFLIVPKASKAERNKGCEDLPFTEMPHTVNTRCAKCGLLMLDGRSQSCKCEIKQEIRLKVQNHHPTVKPLKLMSYLITMGSREGDLVLDPFCGSGTVCIAADQLHRKWIGIERNPEYAEIIKKRLMIPLSQLKLGLYV